MHDGTLLAADVLRPETEAPVPALLGFYPYHKEAGIAIDLDYANHWFAERGYASLLVDIRGTGCSEGQVSDPFDAGVEAVDGVAAVEWVSAQPWCDGNVGVWGVSYGAITALSIAARRPPALKAIAPVLGCPDPLSDWFYPGGCEACQVAVVWGTQMVALQLAPPLCPDPDGRFKRLWRERLATSEPPLLPWRTRSNHEAYRAASRTEIERITVPTFVIGGWRDVFADASVRTYERITAPRKLLMGPWGHEVPDEAGGEPFEYFEELAGWWDRWLRGAKPPDPDPPVTLYVQGKGYWKREDGWPLPSVTEQTYSLTEAAGLTTEPCIEEGSIAYEGDPTVGSSADDRRSLTWTGPVLAEPLEITGSPDVALHVALERGREANLVARLCDVAPDGTSTLIATGWLKLGGGPSPARQEVTVPIQATSYELVAGHRLRVAVSLADFPHVWPTAENPRIAVHTGGSRPSRVRLPVAPANAMPLVMPSPDPTVDRRPHTLDSASTLTAQRYGSADEELTVRMETKVRSTAPGLDAINVSEESSIASVEIGQPDQARVTTRAQIHRTLPDGSEATVDVCSVATLGRTECTGRVELDGEVLLDRRWHAVHE
ncbi:MAG TPA: CocE/NonD family hydrolase [Solirubrobacterales bacterium]|nr:CocE/NonD family hydrolase [Solirubrobacterales bacterium]